MSPRYHEQPDVKFAGKAVHVWKGRNQHIALNAVKTYCGKGWVATIASPPATDVPPCARCSRLAS